MKSYQDFFYLASNPGIFTIGILRLGFAISKLILSIFPNAVLTALTKDTSKVDEELFLQNEELKNRFIEIYNTSLRQDTDIPAYEAIAIFQNKLHFEDNLRCLCEENSDFKLFPWISLLLDWKIRMFHYLMAGMFMTNFCAKLHNFAVIQIMVIYLLLWRKHLITLEKLLLSILLRQQKINVWELLLKWSKLGPYNIKSFILESWTRSTIFVA